MIVFTWPVTVMTETTGVGVHVDCEDGPSSEAEDAVLEVENIEEVVGGGGGGGLDDEVVSTTGTET